MFRYLAPAAVVLLGLFTTFHLALAQQTPLPDLEDILLRLQGNLQHYQTQVPSFFCDEHVISLEDAARHRQSTVTDSIFRLKRGPGPNHGEILSESREVKAVNGAPAMSENLKGPVVLTGVFSHGLDTVSLKQKACMQYALQPVQSGQAGLPYVIQFTSLPGSRGRSGCVLNEESTGRVLIDPASMQIKRMEMMAPHHVILPATVGVWRISIDYAPVLLGGQSFWMPSTITSTATPNDGFGSTTWSFTARYSNYHKLEVTSHILPSP